jgi:hypothetical protein
LRKFCAFVVEVVMTGDYSFPENPQEGLPDVKIFLARQLHDRLRLDAAQVRRRDLRGRPDSVVQIAGLDENDPAQQLLRLGEGGVGGGHLAVPDPDDRGRVHGLESLRDDVVTALSERHVVV